MLVIVYIQCPRWKAIYASSLNYSYSFSNELLFNNASLPPLHKKKGREEAGWQDGIGVEGAKDRKGIQLHLRPHNNLINPTYPSKKRTLPIATVGCMYTNIASGIPPGMIYYYHQNITWFLILTLLKVIVVDMRLLCTKDCTYCMWSRHTHSCHVLLVCQECCHKLVWWLEVEGSFVM